MRAEPSESRKRVIAILLLTAAFGLLPAGAEDLAQTYSPYGELIVTQFLTAPFPHPSRAEGHSYRHTDDAGQPVVEFYSEAAHYSDSTVAIFIPKGFREMGRVDFVIHFHGWRNQVSHVLERYRLIEQMAESRRNAILIVPQGPKNAPDSSGGKLEEVDGFKRFMGEVQDALRARSSLPRKDFALGNLILSGHSGGYQVMGSILDHGGLTDHVREVWLFDALYARTDQFVHWLDTQHGRLLDIYTEHGGTKTETERLMELLRHRGTPLFCGQEAAVTLEELRPQRACFLFSELPHDEVVSKHETFRRFLETSSLDSIEQTNQPSAASGLRMVR